MKNPARLGEELPPAPGYEVALGDDEAMLAGLAKLREQFHPDDIEKLPKPTYKGAWEGKSGARCDVCHGYHVLDHCIHLDYVGHANTTNRLLDADLFWEWEPLSYTPEGLPRFDNSGGLWIKLTVCGVTRLGYGDGKSVKEVIGDAIRNAAMRFGVALDLWAKIDLHADRNIGDGEPSRRQRDDNRGQGRSDGAGRPARSGSDRDAENDAPPAAQPRPNQDGLDALKEVCDEHGYPTTEMRALFVDWLRRTGRNDVDILAADNETLFAFAAALIAAATPEPEGPDPQPEDAAGDGAGGEGPERGGGDGGSAEPEAGGAPPAGRKGSARRTRGRRQAEPVADSGVGGGPVAEGQEAATAGTDDSSTAAFDPATDPLRSDPWAGDGSDPATFKPGDAF